MKKVMLLLLMGLFFVSFTSAFDWNDDIVSYYKLDNTTGVVYDMLEINHGTNNGATRGVTGILENAFSFDGNNDKITITGQDFIVETAALSVSSFGSANTIFIYQGAWFETNGLTIPINAWNHIATISNATADTIKIYLNGALVDTHTSASYATDKSFSGWFYHNGILAVDERERIWDNTGSPMVFGGDSVGAATKVWNGKLDEFMFLNRVLNQSEVTELYNNGSGLEYGDVGGIVPIVTLVSPTNGTTISDIGTNFTVSGNNLTNVLGTWVNLTYIVWTNDSIHSQTTVSLSGTNFTNTQFIDDFGFETYIWNAEACYTNVTGDYCLSADNNNTLDISLFTLVSETWVNDTISGTLEDFSVTIDILEGYDLTAASFIYNGTTESPSITATSGNRYILVSDYAIPIISINENITFNWDLTFTGDEMLSTDNRIQLVRAVLLDNCSTYTNKVFNISLYDEVLKTSLNGDIELIYTLLNTPDYDIINTIYYSIANVSNAQVCTGINLSGEDLAYSVEIRYVSKGYAPELYHIQRAILPTSFNTINLYDLNETQSTEFKLTYQDSGFNFIEGAIIQLQRKYISEDIYRVVEAPLTSRDGTAVVHVDLDSVKYKVVVVKNGEILDTFDNIVFKCQSELTGECEQQLLGEINPSNDIDWDISRDFAYTISRNDSIVTVAYTIPSTAPSSVNIVLIQKDQFDNVYTCNETVISSAGSIQCSITSTIGDIYVDLYINKDGVPVAFESYIIQEDGGIDFLGNNMIIVVILILSIVGMALTSPEWIILNAIVTMVLAGALYLINGVDFVVGLGSIMWLVIAAVILIFKLTKQEDR